MGIDPGTRRVGVALADEDAPFAEARPTLEHGSAAVIARAIADLARREQVGEIVVGLPIGLDGREGASSRRARALAAAIEQASGLPVVLWDERMTSAAARRALRASGIGARAIRSGAIDRVAAALILESYLDAVRARRRCDAARLDRDPDPGPVLAGSGPTSSREGKGARSRPQAREWSWERRGGGRRRPGRERA